MADVLEQFLECSWRGISFPTQSVDTEITHDLAVHKKADRDGGNVEATGRNPTVYSVKAVFLNTIVPGPMETWSNLFPDTYNLFIEAVEDRSTGDFVHPFHGSRRCKIVKMSESFAAQSRGGPTVTVQFIWTAASGSGGVVWSAGGIAFSDDDALDTAYGTAQGATDTLITANDDHHTTFTSAITIAGSPVAGDLVCLRFAREVADGGDTLGVDARLIGVKVRFGIAQYDDQ